MTDTLGLCIGDDDNYEWKGQKWLVLLGALSTPALLASCLSIKRLLKN